jgi:hypothetical protein
MTPRPRPTFTLRLLGSPAVCSEDGVPIGGAVAQRHRLALLAVLAVAGPAGLRRDALIGLLWPERDDAAARNLLRVALHELRRTLGAAALPGTGDAVRLDPALVAPTCTRSRRRSTPATWNAPWRCTAGRSSTGSSSTTAEPFEQWTGRERERLARRYDRRARHVGAGGRGAARRAGGGPVVAAARGPGGPAIPRWRAKLVESLAAADDVAGALAHAGAHAAHLRAEYGIAPTRASPPA